MERVWRYVAIAKFLVQVIQNDPRYHKLKNALAIIALIKYGGDVILMLNELGFVGFFKQLSKSVMKRSFVLLKSIPFVRAQIQGKLSDAFKDIQQSVVGTEEERSKYRKFLTLPEQRLTEEEIMAELDEYMGMAKHSVEEGKISGTVYKADHKLSQLQMKSMAKFIWANPLHPAVFPGVRKMDAEVVAMTLNMFHGGDGCCGTTTSGGTESIIMAMRAYKEWGREVKGIERPHMIIPSTAHAAFDKAADYFSIRVTHIPVDPVTFKVEVDKVKQAICSNTVAIVGSAPSFPHGIVDPITELGALAKKYNIGLHVDCCLGSFIMPFLETIGVRVEAFDFRVPGVTSISCDPHKYGFAPKGTSVVMYRTEELRRFQYFSCPDWPGGVYASPTIAGSRPGALIVGCWATMVYHGKEGYIETARKIVTSQRKIMNAIRNIPEFSVMGDPEGSILSWTSNKVDIYLVGAKLKSKGWDLSNLQFPPGLHISVTHVTDADQLIADLQDVIVELRKNPNQKAEGSAALYGMSAKIPDRSIIDQIARAYIDALYLPL
eukprot:TRINITY_DN8220_c0_g1_i1.p1 TRINITY_DN8220_c0_g1~~TRINITY_DN8220_c0_g1_i1.p1  ORF type:complete len:548 (-),score=128.18 TRINITY_DN8220_c0_g1_i1:27-1670(-)